MFAGLRSVVERCNRVLGMVSGLGILAMGLILTYEVVVRYALNAPTIWAQEVSIYLYVWTMLAATSYTLEKGMHVHVDLLVERLPPRVRLGLEIATSAIGVVFSAIVSVQAYEMIAATLRFGKVSATPLRVPLWIPQSALLMGFVLLTFQFALLIVDRAARFSGRAGQGGART